MTHTPEDIAKAERAAIVAWLREEQKNNAKVNIGGRAEVSAKIFANACMIIADAIERGAHLEEHQ